jgi:hypothetical protein
MVAFKQTVRIPENHKISIDIPESVCTDQVGEIILIIKDKKSSSENVSNLKQAMNDPVFVSDLNEVSLDFKDIDSHGW